jgi:hypothetical protein
MASILRMDHQFSKLVSVKHAADIDNGKVLKLNVLGGFRYEYECWRLGNSL